VLHNYVSENDFSFVFRNGYPLFIDGGLGGSRAQEMYLYLLEGQYLDEHTERVVFQTVTFNSNLMIPTYVEVSFNRDPGGHFRVRNPKVSVLPKEEKKKETLKGGLQCYLPRWAAGRKRSPAATQK
jgi:hypothetical protein